MDQFSIYLQRELKVILHTQQQESPLPANVLATALTNLEPLGFTFSPAVLDILNTWSVTTFTAWYKKLVKELCEMTGFERNYRMMYPRFPDQVMQMSDAELYINALIHYWTGILPESHSTPEDEQPKIMLLDQVSLRVIHLGTEEEFAQICEHLLRAVSALPVTSREHLIWFANHQPHWQQSTPDVIPNKENAAIFIAALISAGKIDKDWLYTHVQTATDVLRIATALSNGDVSLATNTRFVSFSRAQRKLILALLENISKPLEDMFRYEGRWIRLGERLHPGEYRQHFPQTAIHFDALRHGDRPQTFYSQVEQAFASHQDQHILELLSQRPGEFVRRLDRLIRSGVDMEALLNRYRMIAPEVATPILLSVLAHFEKRSSTLPRRHFFPKGNTAKLFVSTQPLVLLTEQVTSSIIAVTKQALIDKFAEQPDLGQIYIDPQLKKHFVPLGVRSASKSLRTLTRGSWIPLNQGDTLRFFVWWKEGWVNGVHSDRIDIDLSAILYDDQWQRIEHISYMNLRSDHFLAAHSGDIVTAPEGAAEYIDLHLPSVRESGVRYIQMSVNAFTSQVFKDLPECYAGWMMRQVPQSGEVFEASTVQNRIDIAANSRICIPVIVDVEQREMLWTDIALEHYPDDVNNIATNRMSSALIGRAMTELIRPNLYQLFHLHAEAHGTLTPHIEEADIIFTAELDQDALMRSINHKTLSPDAKVITPLDQDQILADFL